MDEGRFPVALLRPAAGGVARRRRSSGNAWTAVEQERRRWARELHDETLQNLAGLLIRLSSVRRGGQDAALAAAVDETITGLQQEIDNLRSLITDLRPAALDELGMEAAIGALARRAAGNGLTVELAVELTRRREERFELETTVYRIVQEALTNAQKHGRARSACVEIRERGTCIEITVCDNGAGFDEHATAGGFGLLGMRERVEESGGTLSIRSRPGAGTTIHATVPLEHRRSRETLAGTGRAA